MRPEEQDKASMNAHNSIKQTYPTFARHPFTTPVSRGRGCLGRQKIALITALTLLLAGWLVPNTFAAPGDLDLPFNPSLDGIVSQVAIQPDGKVLIAGPFTTVNGVSRIGIARLNADGSLDASFDPGSGMVGYPSGLPGIRTMDVQSDGKILIAGSFTEYDGTSIKGMARLNPDGSLDPSFIPAHPWVYVNYFVVQADGKVIVSEGNNLTRLNSDGSLDSGFPIWPYEDIPDTGGFYSRMVRLPDGKVLVGGSPLRRLNSDGTEDTSFPVYVRGVRAIAVQPDGKVLIGGSDAGPLEFRQPSNIGNILAIRHSVARLNQDGTLDTSFDAGTRLANEPYSIAVQRDGKVIIGGSSIWLSGVIGGGIPPDRHGIARLNPNGSVDLSFDPGWPVGDSGSHNVYAVALQEDGKIIIGGGFTSVGGTARTGIARLAGDFAIESLVPDRATAGTGDIAVAVHGAGFDQADATVLFGHPGSQTELIPNPVTSTATRLDIVIPGTVLVGTGDFTSYPITVRGPGGDLTQPVAFTVLGSGVASKVDELQTVVVSAGTTATLGILPATESSSGISATLTITGEEPASVTVATYNADPSDSGNTSFDVAGQFLDLNASGVTDADSMRVYFYFPAGTPTETLSLKFWNTRVTPAAWENVTPVTIDPVLHRIEVVFDANSHPKISELDGTFFAPAVSPAIHFTGFLSPIGGADATGGSFAAPLKTFKSGSTIPVKFALTLGGAPFTTGVHRLQAIKYSDATTAGTPIDATPQGTATTGNEFRFVDGAWQFNLDTKSTGLTTGIWQLVAALSDGSQHKVWIQIK